MYRALTCFLFLFWLDLCNSVAYSNLSLLLFSEEGCLWSSSCNTRWQNFHFHLSFFALENFGKYTVIKNRLFILPGLLYSVFITAVITSSLKDAVGRPRPHFFWGCFPDGKEVCSFGSLLLLRFVLYYVSIVRFLYLFPIWPYWHGTSYLIFF